MTRIPERCTLMSLDSVRSGARRRRARPAFDVIFRIFIQITYSAIECPHPECAVIIVLVFYIRLHR